MSQDIPASQTPVHPVVSVSAPQSFAFPRATWQRWKQIARAIGVVQTRILMIVFFFVFVFPLGLIIRMTGDPLHLRIRTGSNWTPHRQEEASLDSARRQF